MSSRESSASPQRRLFRIITFPWKKRPKETGDGDGKVDNTGVLATPLESDTGRFTTGIDASQSPQSSPVPASVEPHSPEQVASSTPQPASHAQTGPVAQSTTADTVSSPSSDMSERLWNQAYDELKKENDTWVEAYERILSDKLNGGDSGSTNLESQNNEFKDRHLAKRRSIMEELVRRGLKKTEEEAKVKQIIRKGMQGALAIKDMIDFALQPVPQAALAWAGVCFALQVSLSRNVMVMCFDLSIRYS